MDGLYSIGETARIMGISVQTLRNYSNLELLKPQYIDPNTGYRYYSFKQFHYIDRIKYLRNLGVSLSEIEDVFKSNDIHKLSYYLDKQKQRIEKEIKELMETKEDIQWYMNYFNYLDTHHLDNIPYIKHLEKRFVLSIPFEKGDTVETVETRLAILKTGPSMEKVHFLRQFGYIADFKDLLVKKFTRQEYFIYIKDTAGLEKEQYRELPAGEYLCFRAKICTEDWDVELLKKYFEHLEKYPPYIIANEHEDNLSEYHNCPYEVQILINEDL
ncbi:MerR family transcriptional regulator [Anaeromicropila populeti]|uniref:DNA-binding transcriptional regulator, MerR family n=1 Tax=Anaeromicropila populeti TaxID=37658 RepID=A0A1I6IFL5_9FIRM|nr:helix-turn-helix domain-containing protein [Anaeromicropila populeti]SFR65473.1 DNA-binding transcriptional regulator, MerR family [Anaeromicropila populeti]